MSITLDKVNETIANSPNQCIPVNELSFKDEQTIVPLEIFAHLIPGRADKLIEGMKGAIKLLLLRSNLTERYKKAITEILDKMSEERGHNFKPFYTVHGMLHDLEDGNEQLGRLKSMIELIISVGVDFNLFRVTCFEDEQFHQCFELKINKCLKFIKKLHYLRYNSKLNRITCKRPGRKERTLPIQRISSYF